MPEMTFNDLGAIGIIKDVPDTDIPMNAWTACQNMRFHEGSAEKFSGHDQAYEATTASAGPYYALDVRKGADQFWFYADLEGLYAHDTSGDHQNLSSGTYSANIDVNWNGGLLGNGVVIMNNGFDAPQQWTGTTLADKFTDLSNWPAGMVARVVRVLNQFVVAADIDEGLGSGRDGTLLRWSHPAAPGAVPSSWDWEDSTKDAGRTNIVDGGDFIIDMLKMRDSMMVYKGDQLHSMTFVGGRAKFVFRKVFDHVGLLTRRCAKEFYGNHFVLSNSDAVIHDGHTVQSILDQRWRRYLFNAIDATNYQRTFVAVNYRNQEMWLCYPEAGETLPNMALIWNWKENTLSERQLPAGCAHIAWGVVDPNVPDTFDELQGTYADNTQIIDNQLFSGAKGTMVMCSVDDNAFYRADQTNQFNGANVSAYLQRDRLPLGMQTNKGLTYAPHRIKEIQEVWPIIDGDAGGEITISIGSRFNENDAVSWTERVFTIGTDEFVSFRVSGRIIDIKFESNSDISWRLTSYRIVYGIGGYR